MFKPGQLSELSYLQPQDWALLLVLGLDLLLTLAHSIQELNGHLWRYFGAIAGTRIPDIVGFPVFFLLLTAGLWVLAFAGIAGYLPILGTDVPPHWAMAAVGTLIGARLSDRLFSHVRLDRLGYRPNPGLSSTPYYLAEAIALTVLFLPGLRDYPLWAIGGFLIGWLFFYSVLPLLRLLRGIPFFRGDSWGSGEVIPEWAR
jgi:hypothetical protein